MIVLGWSFYFVMLMAVGYFFTVDSFQDEITKLDINAQEIFLAILMNNLKVATTIFFVGLITLGLSNFYFLGINALMFGVSLKLSFWLSIHGFIEMSAFVILAITSNLMVKVIIQKSKTHYLFYWLLSGYFLVVIAAIIEAFITPILFKFQGGV